LTSSNFMFFPFLPFPACFFLHLSGSGKKQGGTGKGQNGDRRRVAGRE
jgi:hypothetical protein